MGQRENLQKSAVIHMTGSLRSNRSAAAATAIARAKNHHPHSPRRGAIADDGGGHHQRHGLDRVRPDRSGVLFPYLLRRNRLSVWLGSVVPLQAGDLRGLNMVGLWLATGGFLFLLRQSAIGLWLRDSALIGRAILRSWHYWLMVGVVILVSIHVWLNG